jgi:hypothetical protein
LVEDTAKHLDQRKKGKKIDYDYFDFHSQYKKLGGAGIDNFINTQVKNLYLTNINLFSEK